VVDAELERGSEGVAAVTIDEEPARDVLLEPLFGLAARTM
jgi:hypothetical protein